MVAPAQMVDGVLESVIWNPNAILGTDSPLQCPSPSPLVQSTLWGHFSAILTRFRCPKRRLLGVRFQWKAILSTKMIFCGNSCFASTRTRFSRFWEPGNHANIVLNLMQNGAWQLTMSKTRKAKLWSQNFVLQGVFGTTRDALRGAQSRSKRHPSSLIRQIPISFLCSGSIFQDFYRILCSSEPFC